MDISTPLLANREPTVLRKPRQCAFYHPPMSPQPLAALFALPGYPALDAALSQRLSTLLGVIALVSVKLLRALARTAPTGTLDRLDGVQQLLEYLRVVDIGGTQDYRERDTPPVRHNMALRARFSLICRIRPGLLAPLFDPTLAESKDARDQSIFSASPRRSRGTRCSLRHTPTSCQSRSRRQQVLPEPQPISLGSISQGIPLFSTKRMPVSAARFGTLGLPPFGLGGSGGRSGPTISHSLSVTSSLPMLMSVTFRQAMGFARCS